MVGVTGITERFIFQSDLDLAPSVSYLAALPMGVRPPHSGIKVNISDDVVDLVVGDLDPSMSLVAHVFALGCMLKNLTCALSAAPGSSGRKLAVPVDVA